MCSITRVEMFVSCCVAGCRFDFLGGNLEYCFCLDHGFCCRGVEGSALVIGPPKLGGDRSVAANRRFGDVGCHPLERWHRLAR